MLSKWCNNGYFVYGRSKICQNFVDLKYLNFVTAFLFLKIYLARQVQFSKLSAELDNKFYAGPGILVLNLMKSSAIMQWF